MITKRCRKTNLLNHLKQKKVKYDLEYNQLLSRDENYMKWEVIFRFNSKKYSIISSRRGEGINNIIDSAEKDIYKYLNLIKKI